MTIRTRFAPSPTGYMHVGNLRTVVFNWLFARQQQGKFILRIEDTDRKRYIENAVQAITNNLEWLGMDWDEGPGVGGEYGPYVQSERLPLYHEKAQELIDKGYAYRCNCTPERLNTVREQQRAAGKTPMYDGHCRAKAPGEVSPEAAHVVRLKMPRAGQTTVHDLLRGEISFDNQNLDDQILIKSDGFPTYHLAVVIDDHMMNVTHIMRGDDWISSTPKRVYLYHALGWEPPIYAHVPLVMGPDGKKLSKRHGAVSVDEFRRQGYLPEALFNFLAMLGWAPGEGDAQEIFTREELIARFDIERINRSAAVLSYDKLNWINGQYIRNLSAAELLSQLIPFWAAVGWIPMPVTTEILPTLKILVPLVQERLKTLRDVIELTDFVFIDIKTPPVDQLIGKKMTAEQSLHTLREVQKLLASLVQFEADAIEGPMRQLTKDLGLKTGQVFTIVRNAVTAKRVTPPLFGSLAAIGRTRTLKRLKNAAEVLVAHIAKQPTAN